MPSAIVMVPTYNEAGNLPELAARLLALDPPIDVLVVDDASPDGTGEMADGIAVNEPRLHVLHRTGKRGYARASVDGLTWALEHGFERICTMDADLSHDPDVLPRLLARIDEGADAAIGSRYVDGGEIVVDWGPMRRAVSRAGSGYARVMTGADVHDCTSGFRCYRRDALDAGELKALRSDGYSFLIELLSLLTRRKARIDEVPITYVDRRAGSSKISRAIVLEALLVTTGIGVRRLFGAR